MEDNEFDFLLPQGEILRTVLVRPELTDYNLKSILRSKGVFLPKYEKEDSIPVFMRTLIGSKCFDEIKELQKVKIEKKKYRTTQLPWQGGNDLLSSIPSDFNLQTIKEEKYKYNPGFEIIGVPSFMPVDGRRDKIEIKFQLEEQSNIKSIGDRNKKFEASLQIELKDDGQIHLKNTKTFTSRPSHDLLNAIESKLEKHYKSSGYVNKDDSYERILFGHFINSNRFLFFLSFTNDIDFLKFAKISDISISPDPEQNIPDEAKEFLKGVENLKIKGKTLKRHTLLSKKVYQDCIFLLSIKIQYKFEHYEGNGVCEIEYSFSDFTKDRSECSEFQFNIDKITFEKKIKTFVNKNKMEKIIHEKIDNYKMSQYSNLKS